MKKGFNFIKETSRDISKEEAELRVNKAFDILFEATLENIKNKDKK